MRTSSSFTSATTATALRLFHTFFDLLPTHLRLAFVGTDTPSGVWDPYTFPAALPSIDRPLSSSQNISFAEFSSSNTVYIKFTHLARWSSLQYTGSTTGAVAECEHSRIRKGIQVQRDKIANAELAVRWWTANDSYSSNSSCT